MIECPSTPIQSDNHDSYFGTSAAAAAAALAESPLMVGATPYFTAPRSPLHQHQEFFNAIQSRYSATDSAGRPSPPIVPTMMNPTLTLPQLKHKNNNVDQGAASLQVKKFKPEDLNELLDRHKESILVIDVRSFVHYSHLHIQDAINVSIPNTILKRPSFTLDKVSEVIVSDSQRAVWSAWADKKYIVLYDQVSSNLTQNQPNAIIYLCNKFQQSSYRGSLGYLEGGMTAFQDLFPNRCVRSPAPRNSKPRPSDSSIPLTPGLSGFPPPVTVASLCLDGGKTPAPIGSLRRRAHGLQLGSLPPPGPLTAPTSMPLDNQAFNPFFSNIRQNIELSHGSIKERFPIRPPPANQCQIDPSTGKVSKRSLRQVIGVSDPSVVPPWLLGLLDQENGPKRLAEMYEVIERTEQQRLQEVMAHHSRASGNLADHPFSIVAGIEMGALNRYTNIWPYEYTRVRIQSRSPGSTGYINASFIEYIDQDPAALASPSAPSIPNCRRLSEQREASPSSRRYRRYISTQGPLPTTFADFWTVVWEQNSKVIVMLTKEEEMNRTKCHRYWPTKQGEAIDYGACKVTLVSETRQGSEDPEDEGMILRQLHLEHGGETRTIHHIQYLGWMDFGVPDKPIGTLKVVHLADQLQSEFEARGQAGPLVVHCSAGCGRAGTFCVIDTIIHRLQNRAQVPLEQLSEAEREGRLDLVNQTVAKFREQRVSMVQTLRQYVYCYEAILWWILCYT